MSVHIEFRLSDRTANREDICVMHPDFRQAYYQAQIRVLGPDHPYDQLFGCVSPDFTPEDIEEEGRKVEALFRWMGTTMRLYISGPTWRDRLRSWLFLKWLKVKSIGKPKVPSPEEED